MALSAPPQLCFVFTKEKAPANYSTKWSDLHPDCQEFLLQIEELMLEYKDKIQRLDKCDRLYHASASTNSFQPDADHTLKELGGISIAIERERPLLQELMIVLKDLMRNTEVAVRSFMMLHARFSRRTVYEFYSGMSRTPSPFLYATVVRFEKCIEECRQRIDELERFLSQSNGISDGSESSVLHSLPKVMSNIHDFFIHAAAKVESIHQYIESMKRAYLADLRRQGDVNDPFLKADKRELAKQEAAAKRVHPNLHLNTSIPQPPTQVVDLYSSMPMAAPPSTSQLPPPPSTPQLPPASPSTPQLPPASSRSGFSLPSIPCPTFSAIFSTPSQRATPSRLATTSSPFGSFASTPQSSTFQSASTPPFPSDSTTKPEANDRRVAKARRIRHRR